MPASTEDLPWTTETFKIGQRVTWTDKAIRYNIPTRSRRSLEGSVSALETGVGGVTFTVTVMWDGYKRPHRYAGSFIRKLRKRKNPS